MTKKISLSACKVSETISPEVVTHAHHWVLETPSGPVTSGKCRGCGEERIWDTWGPEDRWAEYRSKAQINGVASRKKAAK
jgi:hypothetical protein